MMYMHLDMDLEWSNIGRRSCPRQYDENVYGSEYGLHIR